MFEKRAGNFTVLLCDPDPDYRRSLADRLGNMGYKVLPTGNPQITSGLLQEQSFSVLVLALEEVRLSLISTLADARRSHPDMPILIVFNRHGRDTIPAGLADMVLVEPNERALSRALKSLVMAPVSSLPERVLSAAM